MAKRPNAKTKDARERIIKLVEEIIKDAIRDKGLKPSDISSTDMRAAALDLLKYCAEGK